MPFPPSFWEVFCWNLSLNKLSVPADFSSVPFTVDASSWKIVHTHYSLSLCRSEYMIVLILLSIPETPSTYLLIISIDFLIN